ncbi:hypothetical protein [Acidiphilium acidophilum]|uniref:hypothetical protein n=1 Tax=Acidiphilium acidophilum TaxID=76588 RepID=UPI0038CFA631
MPAPVQRSALLAWHQRATFRETRLIVPIMFSMMLEGERSAELWRRPDTGGP